MIIGVVFALSHTLFQMDQREYVQTKQQPKKKQPATLLRHMRDWDVRRLVIQNKHSHSHVRRDPAGMHEAGVNLNC